jgi:hypothetical protein
LSLSGPDILQYPAEESERKYDICPRGKMVWRPRSHPHVPASDKNALGAPFES